MTQVHQKLREFEDMREELRGWLLSNWNIIPRVLREAIILVILSLIFTEIIYFSVMVIYLSSLADVLPDAVIAILHQVYFSISPWGYLVLIPQAILILYWTIKYVRYKLTK